MDRGAWWAIVHRVKESQTWLEGLSTHAQNRKRAGTMFLLSPRKRVRVCSPGLVNQMLPLRSWRLEPLVQTGIQSSFRDTRGSWGGQRAAIVGGRNITRGPVGVSKHPFQTPPAVDMGLGVSMPHISPKFCLVSHLDSLKALATESVVWKLVRNIEPGPYLRTT